MNKSVSREIKFVGLVITVILAVTSIPYAFAVLTAPPEKQFMGLILNVPDHAQYLAWYRGFQTAFLIPNSLTPESNPPLFFNLLWWTLGRFGLYTGLHYALVYQIFRWLAGAFFLILVYMFIALNFPDVLWRRVAFLVVALTSGFGWVLVVLKYTLTRGTLLFPLDVYIAEGNSFLCIMGYPHFIEATGFILLTFWLLIMGERRGQLRYAVYAGTSAFLLGWQHGYDLLIVWTIPAAYIAMRWVADRRLPMYWVKALVITGLLSWPAALYAVLLTQLSPLWEEVLAQYANAGVYTPNPLHLIVLFGLPLVVATFTWARTVRLRREDNPMLFVQVWFLVGFLLNYIPADFQIHMLNSWQVPMIILATKGLYDFIAPAIARWKFKVGKRAERLLAIIFVLAVLPTNVYLWTWRFVDLNRHDYPYYLYRDEVAAMEWLAEHAPADAIVLSSLDTGQYLPALSGRRAFLAHWAQTVDFFQKREMVKLYFSETTLEDQRIEITQRYNIRYVFYGEQERALGSYDLGGSPYLQKVFSSRKVSVYKVRLESLTLTTE